jgi:AraC family transcriptional regulator of arabinose operon
MGSHPCQSIRPHLDPQDRVLPTWRILSLVSERTPGFAFFRPLGRCDLLFSFTIAGCGQVGSDRADEDAPVRSAALWQAGTPQYYACRQPWTQWWLHVQPRGHWQPWLRWPTVAPGFAILHDLPEATWSAVLACGQRIRAANAAARLGGETLHEDLALAACEELILHLWLAWRRRSDSTGDPRIDRSVAAILEAPDRVWSVPELARLVGLSPSRFAHLFRQHLGASPQAWAEGARLQHARDLLLHGGTSVAEAARASGFADPFHFSTRFRRRFGLPPSRCRISDATPAAGGRRRRAPAPPSR